EVVEACAFGVPHKRLGEDVAAGVVLRRDAEVSVSGLRDFVRDRLAAFKVPGLIHIVPEIRKGPAGKVNRGELAAALSTPRSQDRADSQVRSQTPRSDLEQQLAAAWMEFLDLDRIGHDDDVFTVGADSISLVQMLSRLRAWLNVELSLKDLFAAPTVAALAARLASSEHNSSSGLPSRCKPPTDITPARRRGAQPVSIVQEQVLRIDRELPGLPQFNRSVGYWLRGPLDVAALADSLAEVVRRHASLRTRFAWRNGR